MQKSIITCSDGLCQTLYCVTLILVISRGGVITKHIFSLIFNHKLYTPIYCSEMAFQIGGIIISTKLHFKPHHK